MPKVPPSQVLIVTHFYPVQEKRFGAAQIERFGLSRTNKTVAGLMRVQRICACVFFIVERCSECGQSGLGNSIGTIRCAPISIDSWCHVAGCSRGYSILFNTTVAQTKKFKGLLQFCYKWKSHALFKNRHCLLLLLFEQKQMKVNAFEWDVKTNDNENDTFWIVINRCGLMRHRRYFFHLDLDSGRYSRWLATINSIIIAIEMHC